MSENLATAETALIGAALMSGDRLPPGSELVAVADFTDRRAGLAWGAIRSLVDRGEPVDEVAINAEVEGVAMASYLALATDSTPTTANSSRYADIIRSESRLRRYRAELTETLRNLDSVDGADDVARKFAEKIQEIADGGSGFRPRKIIDVAREVFMDIQERAKHKQPPGFMSGIESLDNLLGGLRRKNVRLIGASTGGGKSSLMRQCAIGHAAMGARVLISSHEMTNEEVTEAIISTDSLVPNYRLANGTLGPEHYPKIVGTMDRIQNMTISLEDSIETIDDLCSVVRDYHHREGVDVLMIDYAQLIEGRRERGVSREQEIAYISRRILRLSKSLNIGSTVLTQLNEDRRSRESKALENDASQVAYIDRDEDNQRDVWMDIVKNRFGAKGRANCRWDGSITRFI